MRINAFSYDFPSPDLNASKAETRKYCNEICRKAARAHEAIALAMTVPARATISRVYQSHNGYETLITLNGYFDNCGTAYMIGTFKRTDKSDVAEVSCCAGTANHFLAEDKTLGFGKDGEELLNEFVKILDATR